MNDVDKYVGSYSLNGHTNTITVYYPNKPGDNDCDSHDGWSYGDEDCVCVKDSKRSRVLAHELGHILFYRLLFGPDDEDYDCGLGHCGSTVGYGWDQYAANEKCVTSEAWATFIAGVTYYDDDAGYPYYIDSTDENMEGDTIAGNTSAKACVQNKTTPINFKTPHLCRGNAVRYFWDLYDSTTTGDDGNDDDNLTLLQMKNIWLEFDDGTYNHRDCEDKTYSEDDDNGRNVYDYMYYETEISAILDTSDEMTQNCLNDQDQN